MKVSKILVSLALCGVLTGCNNPGYVLQPSGTHETQAPQIYYPPTATTTVAEVEEDKSENSNKVEDVQYAERYEAAYQRIGEHNLYTEFEVVTTNREKNTTTKVNYFLAYFEKDGKTYSYIDKTAQNGTNSIILSNTKWSYVVDRVNKTAQKAPQGTFTYSKREEFDLLFAPGAGKYIETENETYDGMSLSVDKFSYNDYTYSLGYDNNNELILMRIDVGTKEQCFIFKTLTICTSDELFQISSDYTITDYVAE